jgi:hypothetical protein
MHLIARVLASRTRAGQNLRRHEIWESRRNRPRIFGPRMRAVSSARPDLGVVSRAAQHGRGCRLRLQRSGIGMEARQRSRLFVAPGMHRRSHGHGVRVEQRGTRLRPLRSEQLRCPDRSPAHRAMPGQRRSPTHHSLANRKRFVLTAQRRGSSLAKNDGRDRRDRDSRSRAKRIVLPRRALAQTCMILIAHFLPLRK